MKRTLTLMLLAACFTVKASAQLSNGYYRMQNTYTDRYISIEDNDPANYKVSITTSSVPLRGIRTHKPGTFVSTSPTTIIYIRNAGGDQADVCISTSLYRATAAIKAQALTAHIVWSSLMMRSRTRKKPT